ncbi:hypothetical protein D3C85_1308650 [compost metagenome]
MQLHGTAQVREEHCAEGTLMGREFRCSFRSGDTKAKLAAIRHGNVHAHHVVYTLRDTEHVVVGRARPLRIAHDVFDREHPVQRLVGEGGSRLREGQVADLTCTLHVAGDDHQPHIWLLRHPQDQGDVVCLIQFVNMAQRFGHQL